MEHKNNTHANIAEIKYSLRVCTCDELTYLPKTYIVLNTDVDNNMYTNKNDWAYHVNRKQNMCGILDIFKY